MAIDSVGYVDYFNTPVYANRSFGSRVEQDKNINPFAPQKKRTSATTATVGVLGTIGAIALAIAFRGRIKGGTLGLVNKVKPYVPKSVKDVVKSGLKYLNTAYVSVKKHIPKGVKKFLKDAYKYVTKYIDAGAKFVKKYTYDPIKKLFTSSAAAPKP